MKIMLGDQNLTHIFGENFSSIVIRNDNQSWSTSLINEKADTDFSYKMYCPQSIHGVCVPIVGYEILQSRRTVTMYKLNVIMETKNWFIFRSYNDFVKFDKQLRRQFPGIFVKLPRNGIFTSKFSAKFLEKRQRDLQIYLDVLMQNNEMSNCELTREFLCLSNPPGPYQDLMQCKAYCEQMEETVDELNKKIVELQTELSITKARLAQSHSQNKLIMSMCTEEIKKSGKLLLEKQMIDSHVYHPPLADMKTLTQNVNTLFKVRAETCNY